MKMTKAEALRVWKSLPERVKDPVRRGAALLDRRRPRWLRKIDAAKLDMSTCRNCIVGQVEGSYEDWDNLAPPGVLAADGYWPAAHGFTAGRVGGAGVPPSFPELDRAWSALLTLEQE